MNLRLNVKRLGLLVLIFLIFSLASSTRADSPLWNETKPVPGTVESSASSNQTTSPSYLYLAVDAFDPLIDVPSPPPELTYSTQEASVAGTYILQLVGPVQESWKTTLIELGVKIGDYIPDYAFLVSLQPDVKMKVEALPFVRWVGPYQPAYKLSPQVDLSSERSYRIILAPWVDAASFEHSLSTFDANVSIIANHAVAVLDGEAVTQVARTPQVIWIEPFYLNQLHNNIAAGTIMGGSVAWSNGFTGSGNAIAVTDSGLDTGNPASIHQDFSARVAHISSWPVQPINWGSNCFPNNVGGNDGAADVDSGHGTHVTGSLAGNGAASNGQFKGLAYEAAITFQAVEQLTDWPSSCPLADGYYITGIPADLRLLLNEVFNWGARVQNYSWGGGNTGQYDVQANQVDDFVFDHQDFTILASAGNSGIDLNQDGYTDADSITSPGVAKNLITIGASDNERLNGGFATYTWFGLLGNDFPVNPTRSDYTSDDRFELAAFSSRGPTDDGRIKPDLVAPGTNIVSVRSSQANETGWGVYNAHYMYNGGTSMSSPLAAGAATLVRDYYRSAEDHQNPSAALIKATLINSAVDIGGYGNDGWEAGQPIPNGHEGWGLVNVGAATTAGKRQFFDETSGLTTGTSDIYYFTISSSDPFKVTLVWSDYPASPPVGKTLVNDLNLRLTAPNGSTIYWGNQFLGGWSRSGGLPDTINNVENVYLQVPMVGIWGVEVIGQNVPEGPQPYALVVDGEISLKVPLEVTSMTPSHAFNDSPLDNAMIRGAGFVLETAVQLKKGAQTISATGVNVDTANNRITADFNLTGASAGWWDVIARNPEETAILTHGFYVKDATLPDLVIEKIPSNNEIDPGGLLTYTISIENTGMVSATAAIFTDTLPAGVEFISLTPDCEDGLITTSGGFACAVQPLTLTAGTSVDYTLVVSIPLDSKGFITNQVELTSQETDAYTLNNTSSATVFSGVLYYFLPQTMKHFPLTPSAPQIFPIENGDRDGSYTITWQAGSGPLPTGYDLSENDAIILDGFGGTTFSISGKAQGIYIYRVRAENAQGSGPWSEPQSVTVGSPEGMILNSSFENGPDGSWTEDSTNEFPLITDDFSPNTVTPHSGQWAVWLGGWEDEQSSISQNVIVPSGAQGKNLSFWYWGTSDEVTCGIDVAYVMIDQVAIAEINLCEAFNTNQWIRRTLDLSTYAGSTVSLRFFVQTNEALNSNLFLDDVRLE